MENAGGGALPFLEAIRARGSAAPSAGIGQKKFVPGAGGTEAASSPGSQQQQRAPLAKAPPPSAPATKATAKKPPVVASGKKPPPGTAGPSAPAAKKPASKIIARDPVYTNVPDQAQAASSGAGAGGPPTQASLAAQLAQMKAKKSSANAPAKSEEPAPPAKLNTDRAKLPPPPVTMKAVADPPPASPPYATTPAPHSKRDTPTSFSSGADKAAGDNMPALAGARGESSSGMRLYSPSGMPPTTPATAAAAKKPALKLHKRGKFQLLTHDEDIASAFKTSLECQVS